MAPSFARRLGQAADGKMLWLWALMATVPLVMGTSPTPSPQAISVTSPLDSVYVYDEKSESPRLYMFEVGLSMLTHAPTPLLLHTLIG
jgi:hypothetical protein